MCNVKHSDSRASKQRVKALGISLAVLALCSCGTFVMQLGAYQFLIVLMAGLIYQIVSNRETQNAR